MDRLNVVARAIVWALSAGHWFVNDIGAVLRRDNVKVCARGLRWNCAADCAAIIMQTTTKKRNAAHPFGIDRWIHKWHCARSSKCGECGVYAKLKELCGLRSCVAGALIKRRCENKQDKECALGVLIELFYVSALGWCAMYTLFPSRDRHTEMQSDDAAMIWPRVMCVCYWVCENIIFHKPIESARALVAIARSSSLRIRPQGGRLWCCTRESTAWLSNSFMSRMC